MAQELKLGFEFEFDDRVTENRKTRQWQVWLVLFRRPLKLSFSVNMNLGKLTKKKKKMTSSVNSQDILKLHHYS